MDIQSAEYFELRAKELAEEAKKIYTKADATADDLEKAERIKVQVTDYQKRSANLRELDNVLLDKITEEEGKVKQQETIRKQQEQAKEFKSFGEFLGAIDTYAKTNKRDARLQYMDGETKDLAEGVGSTGGFLVPTQQLNQMYAAASPMAIVKPRATVIPMSARQITVPVLDQTGTTAGTFHWFGGLQVYWQAEASLITSSDTSFRQIELTANELVGYTRASEVLLEDSAVSLEAILTGPMGFAGAMAMAEDYAYFQGNGVGQPLGILSSTGGVTSSVARAVQSSVTYEDLLNMEAQLYSPSNSAVWVISQSQMANIMKMTGPAGSASPYYVYRPSAVEGKPATLLGRPVFFTLDMLPAASTTSVGDVLLADFSFYLVGDRKRVTVDSTRFDRWQYNQVSWKVVQRVDGEPWLSAPITSRDGSTTVSPFVVLGAKST